MKNVLITTLGKGSKKENGYRTVRYALAGNISRPTPFIGLALQELLPQIDRVVVLGTVGSIWDAWWQGDETQTMVEQYGELFDRLNVCVASQRKDQALLDELSRVLSSHFLKEVSCRYIPDALDGPAQLEILQILKGCANHGDRVFIDVTHGFRHLPMLELLSAFLMKVEFSVEKIYYGVFEKSENGIAPIVELSGLLRLREWIEAMAVLRESGSVAPLSRIPSMRAFHDALIAFQFREQMNDVRQARRHAKEILSRLDELPPEGLLFREELEKLFSWAKAENFASRQFVQSRRSFENGHYVGGVILLMESVISAMTVKDGGNPENQEAREAARETLNRSGDESWHILRILRNSFAHDGKPEGRGADVVMRMRGDEGAFQSGMTNLFQWAGEMIGR